MKSFNWKDFLIRGSPFRSLDEQNIEQLLEDKASDEKSYSQGSVILREGEIGESIFMIGKGLVEAILWDEDGNETSLATLHRGEFFGEMALLEQRPRTATVIAKEDCTLLEINGQVFLGLLREHPIVGFEVLLTLSERLRYTNEQITAVKVKDIDAKLRFSNKRLEEGLSTLSAYWEAVDNSIGQTNKRMDDVTQSIERNIGQTNKRMDDVTHNTERNIEQTNTSMEGFIQTQERNQARRWTRLKTFISVVSFLVLIGGTLGIKFGVVDLLKKEVRQTKQNHGAYLFDSGQYNYALEKFEAAINIFPNDNNFKSSIAHYLAYSYQRKCEHDKAIDYWRKHLEKSPGNPTSLYNLGLNYHVKEKYSEATEKYRAAISNSKEEDNKVEEVALFNLSVIRAILLRKNQYVSEELEIKEIILLLERSIKLGGKEMLNKIRRASGFPEKTEKYFTLRCDLSGWCRYITSVDTLPPVFRVALNPASSRESRERKCDEPLEDLSALKGRDQFKKWRTNNL